MEGFVSSVTTPVSTDGQPPKRKRAEIGVKTLRTDRYWVQPLVTFIALMLFVIYSTWRAFMNADYFYEPLISPFYSPCLSNASPPACAVAEPHGKYTGETRFPLIFQNAHRYFFYAGLAFNALLTYDAIIAFRNHEGQWGHASVGTLVLILNAAFLWFYSLSCHSCRHAIGGRLKNFSKHPARYKMWTWVSKLNGNHMRYAWISMVFVAFTDFYVYLVASGKITNFYFF